MQLRRAIDLRISLIRAQKYHQYIQIMKLYFIISVTSTIYSSMRRAP